MGAREHLAIIVTYLGPRSGVRPGRILIALRVFNFTSGWPTIHETGLVCGHGMFIRTRLGSCS